MRIERTGAESRAANGGCRLTWPRRGGAARTRTPALRVPRREWNANGGGPGGVRQRLESRPANGTIVIIFSGVPRREWTGESRGGRVPRREWYGGAVEGRGVPRREWPRPCASPGVASAAAAALPGRDSGPEPPGPSSSIPGRDSRAASAPPPAMGPPAPRAPSIPGVGLDSLCRQSVARLLP